MNKEAATRIVSKQLKEIAFVENADLIVGQHISDQYKIGTYFIDYGDENFPSDLKEYQEKHISSHYYEANGYLQWNYYLIFLRDTIDEKRKKLIEVDGIYTRKFVFTPEQFNNYFDYQYSKKAVDTDVVSLWKEKLRENDLDEVYTQAPYTKVISRFISNQVEKEKQHGKKGTKESEELKIDKISRLSLKDNYRPFPKRRDFELGQVNLISGVNGTGKTSFLEAIELMVAGKSNRDPFFNEHSGSLEALYNDNVNDIYQPKDYSKYRQRDNNWFAGSYKSGNELHRAFNKYNFYDSDAAYSLSHESSVNNITKYFSSIALGSEFNRIQERMKGVKDRLNTELRIRKKEIETEKAIKIENEAFIQNTKLTTSPESAFVAFSTYAIKIKWKKELPKSYGESFSIFTEDYQTAQAIINSINQILVTAKLSNLDLVQKELKKLENCIKKCRENRTKANAISEELSKSQKSLGDIRGKLKTLEYAKKYFNDELSFELWKLHERINKLSTTLSRDQSAVEYFENVTKKEIFQTDETFLIFKKGQLETHKELTDRRKELNTRIEKLKLNLNKLQELVADIKSYGKQYITLNNKAESCPLCETSFSFEDLSSKISYIANSVKENLEIDKLTDEIMVIDVKLKATTENIDNIKHIESGLSMLYDTEIPELSLKNIESIFHSKKKNIEDTESSLLALKATNQKLNDKGFTEDDFNKAKEEFELAFPNISFSIDREADFNKKFSEVKKLNLELSKEIRNADEKFLDLQYSLSKILENVAPSINTSDFEKELTYRIGLLNKVKNNFIDLDSIISVSKTEDVSDLSLKLDKLIKLFQNISASIAGQEQLSRAKNAIIKAEQKILQVNPIYKRIFKAFQVITSILEDYGESKVLDDFIKDNENEIQSIFQKIHAPNEFAKIIFSSEKNSILLKRRFDDESVPLNKISTGQRSAIALSIFLALNKKLKNGPNIILLDDPVTYTDDLNILSFLDYLREITIHEKRQLIFATANQKIAGLFEKKFSFLGNGNFSKFHFER